MDRDRSTVEGVATTGGGVDTGEATGAEEEVATVGSKAGRSRSVSSSVLLIAVDNIMKGSCLGLVRYKDGM